ncbi:MAG: hypothetical protein JRI89_16000 [Deltaproteobacteria bacterium]|nr:hypothetical protein [Deltaproteobacteria bacterium]
MILQCCLDCDHHLITGEGANKTSFCSKENCWARYSRCVAEKALDLFLAKKQLHPSSISALELLYRSDI